MKEIPEVYVDNEQVFIIEPKTDPVRCAPARPAVVLHSRDCACRGTGWISYPGIGRRAAACASPDTRTLDYHDWLRLGRPKTIEELDGRIAREMSTLRPLSPRTSDFLGGSGPSVPETSRSGLLRRESAKEVSDVDLRADTLGAD